MVSSRTYLLMVITSVCVSASFCGAQTVIIEHGRPGTSYTGHWYESGGTEPYGQVSLWSRDGATYSWEMAPDEAGTYEVQMWWSGFESRSDSVEVRIEHGLGTEVMRLDQQQRAGQWNSLGSYWFEDHGRVTITASYGVTVSTCADSVKFEYIDQAEPPTAVIDSIEPNPAQFEQSISFSGHGLGYDDLEIAGHQWLSSVDGFLSDEPAFESSQLSQAVHIISYSVQDETGLWSQEITEVLTVGEPQVDVIIDNRDQLRTSWAGLWQVSEAGQPYGEDSFWSRDGASFTWHFVPAVSGEYELSMWWTEHERRSDSAAVEIEHAYGQDTVIVDQTGDGGQWNVLGRYSFTAQAEGTVTILAENPWPDNYCADAVRFTLIDDEPQPKAEIDSISPNPAVYGQTVTFVGKANVDQALYEWQSDIDGLLSDQAEFSTDSLSAGVHRITLVVTDDQGRVSEPAEAELVVQSEQVEIIIDNNDPQTSSTGLWQVSGAPDPWGDDSLWSRDGATFTWHFEAPVSGRYELSMWWTQWDSRSTSVPIEVVDAGGLTELRVNQQENGGQWNSLGEFVFAQGQEATVTVVAEGPWPYSYCADAVRFTYVGQSLPIAGIDSIEPNPAQYGQMVSFVGSATAVDGSIEAYQWSSSIDGPLSEELSFSSDELSVGVHTIELVVYDQAGRASEAAQAELTVRDEDFEQIIIDNGDPGTSFTGSWLVSGAEGYWGQDSLWSRDGATYSWSFTAGNDGLYEVAMWWTQWPSRSTSVPVEISTAGGIEQVTVNQQDDGGQWNVLGNYGFRAGQQYTITITAQPGPSSTCADAVKITYISPTDLPPAATIESVEPNPAGLDDVVTFVGSAQYIDPNDIVEYQWSSDIDGLLSDQASFSSDELSQGTHTISLRVMNEAGLWSADATERLNVGVEEIFILFAYNWDDPLEWFTSMLLDLDGAVELGSRDWSYSSAQSEHEYRIRFRDDSESFKTALTTADAHVIIMGHSNYGLGPIFATGEETAMQVIEDMRYIDDSRIVNMATETMHVSVRGMRTGQAYPYWWPEFKDGTSGIMPYDFDDDRGAPPYSYYLTYQLEGDPNHYRIESGRNSALKRFFDYDGPTWYAADGSKPDVNNPNHRQYFIINPEPQSPSFETTGSWIQHQVYDGSETYYRENFLFSLPGAGENEARFMFSIPKDGYYEVFSWWPVGSGHSSMAPYRIEHSGGTTLVEADQSSNGQQWNLLGEFYYEAGDYEIVLNNDVNDGIVIADGIRISHIENPENIVSASFSAYPRQGTAPLDVVFYNESVGDFTDRHWDFGDGHTNITRDSLRHQYTRPGLYPVSLTVSGPMGSDSVSRQSYILVTSEPTSMELDPEFRKFGSDRNIPFTVSFSNLSTGNFSQGITYRADTAEPVKDSFTYRVRSTTGAVSNAASVYITITEEEIFACDNAFAMVDITSMTLDIAGNDYTANDDLDYQSIEITAWPAYGSIDGINDGLVQYSVDPNFTGIDSFSYTISTIDGQVSNEAVVSIERVLGRQTPLAVHNHYALAPNEELTFDVTLNDYVRYGSLVRETVSIISEPLAGQTLVHVPYFWEFGDGATSYRQNTWHTYTTAGNYTVRLTVTDAQGNKQVREKPNYIRALVHEDNIDNVDYPKPHFRSKTVLYTPDNAIDPNEFRYGRMLYDSCNSANYYLEIYQRGVTYSTVANSSTLASVIYLRNYLLGEPEEVIWQRMQDYEPVYDYYDFDRTPDAQPAPIAAKPIETDEQTQLQLQSREDLQELVALDIPEVFERLQAGKFIANEQLLRAGIDAAFADRAEQAVDFAVRYVQSPKTIVLEGNVVAEASGLFAAKNILQGYPQLSERALSQAYNGSAGITRGHILRAAGGLLGRASIRRMFIDALGDKSPAQFDPGRADGEPMRVCDMAYNQVMIYRPAENLARTIRANMRPGDRDYHIRQLRSVMRGQKRN